MLIDDLREDRNAQTRMLWANTCDLRKGEVTVLDAFADFDDYTTNCTNYAGMANCPAAHDEKSCDELERKGAPLRCGCLEPLP